MREENEEVAEDEQEETLDTFFSTPTLLAFNLFLYSR